jgi:hypothetical protein
VSGGGCMAIGRWRKIPTAPRCTAAVTDGRHPDSPHRSDTPPETGPRLVRRSSGGKSPAGPLSSAIGRWQEAPPGRLCTASAGRTVRSARAAANCRSDSCRSLAAAPRLVPAQAPPPRHFSEGGPPARLGCTAVGRWRRSRPVRTNTAIGRSYGPIGAGSRDLRVGQLSITCSSPRLVPAQSPPWHFSEGGPRPVRAARPSGGGRRPRPVRYAPPRSVVRSGRRGPRYTAIGRSYGPIGAGSCELPVR